MTPAQQKIIAYLRVSTEKQGDSGLGLEAQLQKIRERYGEPHRIYKDVASGKDVDNRPALLEALDKLKPGQIIVASDRDRFSREPFYMLWIEKEVKVKRAELRTVTDPTNGDNTPGAELMRAMVDAFAAYERKLIALRTRASMAALKARGSRYSRLAPYGWKFSEDGQLEPWAEEREIIQTVRGLRAEGLSMLRIESILQARGITCIRGEKPYRTGQIAAMLKADC